MPRSEEAYFGPGGGRGGRKRARRMGGGAFQTLVKHDMTDRQLHNPLKETVSPLVKTVPGYACRPQRLEARIQLGNAIQISN